ncbi:hypothetical protein [Corynebacterium sp. UMB10321]|uniref:hypothetical protein n=1 Tax=Corynebacterium sp. UMB10321 TaxID=3046312 RepID=UPI00254B0C14|nr:hypothetical protein [Corynebacterium sp. UMB10321]MDK8244742.1 hypothetical protein [Corynebacterium sp. UMB10321]
MKINARVTLLLSCAIAGVFAFWGGWTRRWMSDDGLIVLRTVRNLLAGNGPVFNAGERVEANTSTLWQYLITAFAMVSDARLETIAMWLALLCTVVAAVLATYAAGRFWRTAPVVPLGILVYFALPPARDFATSGLEWGLSLLWLAAWWALLVQWAGGTARRAAPVVGYWLAFWCGLSWLVRPELALYGGLTGLVLLVYSPRKTLGILAAALPVPAAYQIFRMGYYGLLTPHTAVAKSASGSEWAEGAKYAWDFIGPYALYLPLLLVIAVLLISLRRFLVTGRRAAIVALVVGCALIHILYVLRVGGDFMHGRMWLLPLFALLLPVMAAPLTRLNVVVALVVAVWASIIVVRAHPLDEDIHSRTAKELGIVDEREFWTMAVNREPDNPPRYAEDFLGSKLMTNYTDAVIEARDAHAAQIAPGLISRDPELYSWYPRPRVPDADSNLQAYQLSLYLINLGMTSMNAPLDVRVLDTVGLATPLAARMPRDPEGRVGHDKQLAAEWQVADTAVDLSKVPEWIDQEEARQARAALRSPEIAELLATSREPMSRERFWKNIKYSLGNGRTLQLSDDPSTYLSYLTDDEQARLSQGEDLGIHSGTRVVW